MELEINFSEKYQLFYLKKAINEYILKYDDKTKKKIIENLIIREDHINGCNYINNIRIPIIFPLYIKNYIYSLGKRKYLNYFYQGTIVGTKTWITKYINKNKTIINKSLRGRTQMKYDIDKRYYDLMSKSKFTLCPTEWGKNTKSWTYRFFEAIMSLSIPILEKNSNDMYKKYYFFYYDEDNHIYRKDKAIENYKKFIHSRHFLNNLNENILYRNKIVSSSLSSEKKIDESINSSKKKIDESINSSEKKIDESINSSKKKIDEPINSSKKKIDEPINSSEKKIDEPINSSEKKIDEPINSSLFSEILVK